MTTLFWLAIHHTAKGVPAQEFLVSRHYLGETFSLKGAS
jgi:hypothetical protein